jgi:hypothetical protein
MLELLYAEEYDGEGNGLRQRNPQRKVDAHVRDKSTHICYAAGVRLNPAYDFKQVQVGKTAIGLPVLVTYV